MLAWDCGLLPRVSMVLATLDEKIPKVELGNSPHRSLLEIFKPWHPQTTARVEERVKVLKRLAEKRQDAGWRLLNGLLPNPRPTFAVPIQRPLWRDWALGWSRGVAVAEYWHQVGASAHLLVEHLGDDIERWTAIIQQFENLPGPVLKEFLKRLNRLAERTLDEETRRSVSDALWAGLGLAQEVRCRRLGASRGNPGGTGTGSATPRAGRRGT